MSQQRRTYNQRQALSRYEERRRQEEARREMLQRRREKEQESRNWAKGPIDLPFCLLVLLLTAVGLVMLLSASFPSAYHTTKTTTQPTTLCVRASLPSWGWRPCFSSARSITSASGALQNFAIPLHHFTGIGHYSRQPSGSDPQ